MPVSAVSQVCPYPVLQVMSAPETRSVFEATQDQELMGGLRQVTDPHAQAMGLQTEPSTGSRGADELQIGAEWAGTPVLLSRRGGKGNYTLQYTHVTHTGPVWALGV